MGGRDIKNLKFITAIATVTAVHNGTTKSHATTGPFAKSIKWLHGSNKRRPQQTLAPPLSLQLVTGGRGHLLLSTWVSLAVLTTARQSYKDVEAIMRSMSLLSERDRSTG